MNRRAFLRFLGLTPVVGPAVAGSISQNPWSRPVMWMKECDYGRYWNLTISTTNLLTGEHLRNGIRVLTLGSRQENFNRILRARGHLKAWLRDQAPGPWA